MPAVQDILSTINQLAQARLPWGSRRATGFEASRSVISERRSASVRPESSDQPESAYAHAGAEPLLDEVLCDPVVQLIMQADRVHAADLHHLLDGAPREPAVAPLR